MNPSERSEPACAFTASRIACDTSLFRKNTLISGISSRFVRPHMTQPRLHRPVTGIHRSVKGGSRSRYR